MIVYIEILKKFINELEKKREFSKVADAVGNHESIVFLKTRSSKKTTIENIENPPETRRYWKTLPRAEVADTESLES